MTNWAEHFTYDETSPSCLRWNHDIWTGRGYKICTVRAGDVAGYMIGGGYWEVSVDSVGFKVARVVWELHNGTIPDGVQVDHRDTVKTTNRISNLRLTSNAINCRNKGMSRANRSGVTGVTKRVRTLHGRTQTMYIAFWHDLGSKARQKSFSCSKYGDGIAFRLACDYRKQQIEALNTQGAGYTEDHGTRT